MMTRKDFIALANAICDHNAHCGGFSVRKFSTCQLLTLASFCQSKNSRFDRARWLGYIRGECGPNGGRVRTRKPTKGVPSA